jgi:hypothetical protein
MKRRLFVAFTFVFAVADVSAVSASRAAELQTPVEAFAPMSFLAGSCWKGAFKDRPSVTDEHCFEWVYGGKFLQDKHVVRGDSLPYEGQTMFAWNSQAKRVVYWYIALPGFYSTGTVDAKDQRIMFIDDLHEAAGRRDLRSVWVRTGAETFSVRTEDHTGGTVKELWSMEMRRVKK